MKLTDEQKTKIAAWIAQGKNLSQIQQALADELQIVMTYMDVRFLVDDLGLAVQEKAPAKEVPADLGADAPQGGLADADALPPGAEADAEGLPESGLPPPADENAPHSAVTVSVDRIMRPGAVASGEVVFSDGVKAAWQLDQMGRLGLSNLKEGYRPSQADVQAFQIQLQEALSKSGGAF